LRLCEWRPRREQQHAAGRILNVGVGVDRKRQSHGLPELLLEVGRVSDDVEIALGGVSGSGNMTRSGDEIKMH